MRRATGSAASGSATATTSQIHAPAMAMEATTAHAARFERVGRARDDVALGPQRGDGGMVGRLDALAVRQPQHPRHAGDRRVRRDACARHARSDRAVRDRDVVLHFLDANGDRVCSAAVVENAVEGDHSDTSTSKRSPTSEPVAVPAVPGAAGERCEQRRSNGSEVVRAVTRHPDRHPRHRESERFAMTATMLLK